MRHSEGLLIASFAVTLLLPATPAAGAVVFGPQARAQASASAHQGPNIASSGITVENGAVVQSSTNPGGTVSGGPLEPGSTEANAQATQTGFSTAPLNADSSAHADLATGTIRARVLTSGPNTYGSPLGYASGQLADTIYFNNSTAGDVVLALSYAFEGAISSFSADNSSAGDALLQLSGCGGCGNAQGVPIRFRDGSGLGDAIQGLYNEQSGVYGFSTFSGFINGYGDTARWTTDPFGTIGAIISTSLIIPTGTSSLGVRFNLQNDCRGADSCDFGNTALFRFGALPAGLSSSSESGVFLSAITSGVPEPAAWAMMITGFGIVGGSMRRRRSFAAALA